jgi:hypothetical protein
MTQLGHAPFEGFHHDISTSVQACNLALVCRLWQDLSEEVRYRHLHVSDINSIQRLKALVTKSAFNRIQPPSSFDPRYRTRGSWTHSLTIVALATVPLSFYSAHGFHLERALLSLLSCLPNIRQFVLSLAIPPSRHLLNSLPKSISHLSFGQGGSIYLRLLPRQVCTRVTMLDITTSGDMQGYPVQLTSLLWLSIRPRTCVITDWEVPKLCFLSIALSTGDETALSDTTMRKLGTNLLRIELQNVGNIQMAISDGFLRWCPQLETLIFDFPGFTFLDNAIPQESRSFSSIRTVVLVIKKWSQFRLTGDSPPVIDELDIHIKSLSDLILRSLPNLTRIVLSFSRIILFNGDDLRKEMECEFKARINIPISVVFF